MDVQKTAANRELRTPWGSWQQEGHGLLKGTYSWSILSAVTGLNIASITQVLQPLSCSLEGWKAFYALDWENNSTSCLERHMMRCHKWNTDTKCHKSSPGHVEVRQEKGTTSSQRLPFRLRHSFYQPQFILTRVSKWGLKD